MTPGADVVTSTRTDPVAAIVKWNWALSPGIAVTISCSRPSTEMLASGSPSKL